MAASASSIVLYPTKPKHLDLPSLCGSAQSFLSSVYNLFMLRRLIAALKIEAITMQLVFVSSLISKAYQERYSKQEAQAKKALHSTSKGVQHRPT
jgi:hypothetical protein